MSNSGMTGQSVNREAWLTDAVTALAPLFADAGHPLPPVRVSVGWPGGRGKKSNVIGQCWATCQAEDAVAQVFISPVLVDVSGPQGVLATLVHELAHAVDDCNSKHGGAFRKIATAVGLEGRMTATVAGQVLAERLRTVAEGLGPYPHAMLTPTAAQSKPQSTRMLKASCVWPDCEFEGYTVRLARKWIEVAVPVCPGGHDFEIEKKEDEE